MSSTTWTSRMWTSWTDWMLNINGVFRVFAFVMAISDDNLSTVSSTQVVLVIVVDEHLRDCTSSRLQTSPHRHQMRVAAQLQTPGRHLHCDRCPITTKTPVRAPLSFSSSTASMRHTSGGRMLFCRLLLPRTSSLLCLAPSHRTCVSRSSSSHTGLNSRPCAEVRWHTVRGAAHAAHASEAQSHCPGFYSSYGNEGVGGAS